MKAKVKEKVNRKKNLHIYTYQMLSEIRK